MDNTSTIAVVRADRRRGGVAQALALIAHDLARVVRDDPQPVLIPNLDNPARPVACTHAETLGATVDALLHAGAAAVAVAGRGGGQGAGPGDPFTCLGYRRELWSRPAQFVDIDTEPFSTIRWITSQGEPRAVRVASAAAGSRCRVVLGQAKTHGVLRAGLGFSNLGAIVHPDDHLLLGESRFATFLEAARIPVLRGAIPSWSGAVLNAWLRMRTIAGGMRLTGPQRRWLAAVERATSAFVALAAFTMPRISLVDAFHAGEGRGPRQSRPVALRTIIAGTDAVAVDAVAAAVMGFEPMELAYLRLAQATGLGTADLAAITVVGDPITRPGRFRRHPADPVLRLAGAGPVPGAVPQPHFGRAAAFHTQSPSKTQTNKDAGWSDAHRV